MAPKRQTRATQKTAAKPKAASKRAASKRSQKENKKQKHEEKDHETEEEQQYQEPTTDNELQVDEQQVDDDKKHEPNKDQAQAGDDYVEEFLITYLGPLADELKQHDVKYRDTLGRIRMSSPMTKENLSKIASDVVDVLAQERASSTENVDKARTMSDWQSLGHSESEVLAAACGKLNGPGGVEYFLCCALSLEHSRNVKLLTQDLERHANDPSIHQQVVDTRKSAAARAQSRKEARETRTEVLHDARKKQASERAAKRATEAAQRAALTTRIKRERLLNAALAKFDYLCKTLGDYLEANASSPRCPASMQVLNDGKDCIENLVKAIASEDAVVDNDRWDDILSLLKTHVNRWASAAKK